jgi:ABC-type antimicrobial peptide transport system permease subunit
MLKIIVKSLTGHRIRVFLTIVSIAGGVMVFVSLSALLQGLEISVYETFQKFSGERDVLLVEGAADINILVEHFCISTIGEVVHGGKKILVKHTDFDDFEKLGTLSMVEGGAPAPGECVIDYFFSQKEGIFLGDTVATYTVVGIFLHEKGFYTPVITVPGEGYFITEAGNCCYCPYFKPGGEHEHSCFRAEMGDWHTKSVRCSKVLYSKIILI